MTLDYSKWFTVIGGSITTEPMGVAYFFRLLPMDVFQVCLRLSSTESEEGHFLPRFIIWSVHKITRHAYPAGIVSSSQTTGLHTWAHLPSAVQDSDRSHRVLEFLSLRYSIRVAIGKISNLYSDESMKHLERIPPEISSAYPRRPFGVETSRHLRVHGALTQAKRGQLLAHY